MELFRTMAGIVMVHVPYKGAPLALTDVISGQIQMMTPPMPAAMPHVRAGKLRALAVTGSKRTRAMPDLPTIAEAAVPGYEADGWIGVLVPAGTPRRIVEKLNSEIGAILGMPGIAAYLLSQGAEASPTTPEQFAAFIKAEIAKWANVIKTARIHAE